MGSAILVGAARWNRAFNAWLRAFNDVCADPGLIALARNLVQLTDNPAALRFLYELLTPPIGESDLDVDKLLAAPQVALSGDRVQWAYALYVVDHTRWGRDDPYESDRHDPELARSLSRTGGAPTRLPGNMVPSDPFLLQVDLGEQLQDSLWQPRATQFMTQSGLPKNGLLQLFHTTMGDSETDPATPGGGATVLYMTESELRNRRPTDLSHDCVMFPVHDAALRVLPTFAFLPRSKEDTVLQVIELQHAVDRFARGDEVSRGVELQEMANPFRVTDEAPSRMLGLSHYDYPLERHDGALLRERLPLVDAADDHVLLFNVASDFSFDSIFGDIGRLEVWIRRSDLTALRFDQVFSLMRSG